MSVDVIEKHVKDIAWIREKFLSMDDMANPILGIKSWDDSVCLDFEGRLVASIDGPYAKRLVMKSALIHAATDVVVKGARPLFALDSLAGPKNDVEDMVNSLKDQALAMEIPVLGGNTKIEDVEPICSLTVVGKLLLDEPIRDDGVKKDDVVVLMGEPIWGEQQERIEKAKVLFTAWYKALDTGVKINASKDVTKGGLVSVVYEMAEKSSRKFILVDDIPYSTTRNLDNFILTLAESEYKSLEKICTKHDCRLVRIGTVG